MPIKTTTTLISKIIDSDRFEPRYHLIYNKLEEYEKTSSKLIKFGDKKLLQTITDGEHAGQIFVEKGVRFIKNSAVRDFNINLLDGFYITEKKHKQLKRSSLKELDILFTTIGHLGSAAIVPKDFGEANINQNVVKIEIDNEFMDPYYLTAYLNCVITKKQISALFTGNIHKILTYPKIKNIRIIIPDSGFEKKISDKYKSAIEKDKKSFDLINRAIYTFYNECNIDFDKITKVNIFSTARSAIQGSDLWTPKNFYPLYLEILKLIENKWPTVSLGEIVNVKKGNEVGSVNYNKYLDKKDDDVPFIRTSDLVNYEVDMFPDFFIPKEIYSELKQDIKPFDVLYSNDGKIGLVAMLSTQNELILQSHIKRIRLKPEAAKKYNLTQEYLFLVLAIKEIGKFQSERYTVIQSTIATISNRILNFKIPILEEDSIKKITSLVRSAFEIKDEKTRLIKEIREEMDEYGIKEISL